jgi:26S proteasome non-ATPase regulatory subunit 10
MRRAKIAFTYIQSAAKLNQSSKLLIAKSIKPLRIKDTQGSLPIHRAAAIGSSSLVNLYMFPDPSQKAASPINGTDKFGMTPLHHACAEGHVEVAALLVQLGADTDRTDKEGQTPIQCAPDDKTRQAIRRSIGG